MFYVNKYLYLKNPKQYNICFIFVVYNNRIVWNNRINTNKYADYFILTASHNIG